MILLYLLPDGKRENRLLEWWWESRMLEIALHMLHIKGTNNPPGSLNNPNELSLLIGTSSSQNNM